ncbi:hypothetical protein G5V59_17645 [Nocardioides sp. W3-2-3]|nr:hypothetical protein [Nocardioides convexus]
MLKGPRNAFPFVVAPSYLFVAGGIGVTPILPMVRFAAAHGEDWRFVYAGRDRASLPFLAEVEALAAAYPGRVEIWPDDERGVPDAAAIVERAPEGAALYCCGPPAMIDALRAEVPAENVEALHAERFSAPPVVGGEAFTVEPDPHRRDLRGRRRRDPALRPAGGAPGRGVLLPAGVLRHLHGSLRRRRGAAP